MFIPNGILDLIAKEAADGLLQSGTATGDREHLVLAVRRAVQDELDVERRLRDEADKLLTAHMGAARSAGADVGELRARILNKLAKERGEVLR